MKNTIKMRIKKSLNSALIIMLALTLATPTANAATVSASQKPPFQADLTSTLKLQAGSGNPTFARATTAYVQDFEGILRPVISGEARFQGARRIYNQLAVSSEDFTAGPWTKSNVSVTANQVAAPNGTMTADKIDFLAVANARIEKGTVASFTGGTGVASVWLRADSPTTLRMAAGGTQTYTDISVTTSWQRFSVTRIMTVAENGYFIVSSDGSGAKSVYAWGAQWEDVTGQSNQNPSEYVSCGVLAAPYHGAGVDCVKYSNAFNGNTVTSNVVGEASGGKITSAQAAAAGGVTAGVVDASGPMGYLAEGARTNLALQSQTFGTTWTTSNSSLSADAATAPDGTLSADKLIEDGTENVHWFLQTGIAGSPSTTYTYSVYVKPNGRSVLLGISSGSYGAQTAYNLSTNTVIAGYPVGTGSGTPFTNVSSTLTTLPNGWYRVTLTSTTIASSGTLSISVQGANPANPTPNVYTGDGASGLYVWGAQLEAGSFASSYIPTTTGTATRNADSLTYASTGNVSGTVGSAYAEVKLNGLETASDSGNNGVIDFDGNRPIFVRSRSANSLSYYDGTNNPNTFTWNDLARHSMAIVWSGASATHFFDGSANAATSFDGNFDVTDIAVGVQNSGVGQTFGTIRNVKIWKKALTGTQLTTMTNTGTATSRAAIPQTTVKAPTKTGLVGAWTFDEGTGTRANDSSGLGNTGTLVGSPVWTTGKLGKALSFTGSNYVDTGTKFPTLTTAITVSAWVNPGASQGAYADIWGNHQGGFAGMVLQQNNTTTNQYSFAYGTGTTWAGSGNFNLTANTWSHVVAVKDASYCYVYINGVEQTGVRGNCTANIQPAGNMNFSIGLGYSDAGRYFAGKVDDTRVYNRALSATEIAALYRSTAIVVNASTNTVGGSLTSGLVGLWSFDGKDMNWGTNKALDRGSGGNHGTLTGMSTSTSPAIGKIGQALRFDGVDDVVNLGTSATFNLGAGSFSLCAWFKTTGTEEDIIANSAGPDGSYLLMSYLGKVRGHIWYSGNANSIDSNATVNNGAWQHTCQVVDSTNIYLYINGSLDKSQALVGTKSGVAGTGMIGHRSTALGAAHFEGSIDDVRLYNRALSATEARALYNLGR